MHSRYNRLRINALREKGERMARARWDKDRAERDARQAQREADLRTIEIENLPRSKGDVLGVMQWTCASSGRVRRWVIRIGDRCDRITVESSQNTSHGWTWFFEKLRKHILK